MTGPLGLRRAAVVPAVVLVLALALTAGGCSRTDAPPAEKPAVGDAATAPSSDAFVAAPTTPPAAGVPLQRLSSVPDETLAAFEPGADVAASDTYDVVFEPIGAFPAERPTLVVKIVSARPSGTVAHALALDGRMVLAEIGDQSSEDVLNRGGRYAGVLGMVARSGLLQPELKQIRPAGK